MALASPPSGNHHWWITGVYGPQDDRAKIEVLAELQDASASCIGPWIFNMILSVEDKNNNRLNSCVMHRLHCFTNDMELRDLYLHGRRYTWSNDKSSPRLSGTIE